MALRRLPEGGRKLGGGRPWGVMVIAASRPLVVLEVRGRSRRDSSLYSPSFLPLLSFPFPPPFSRSCLALLKAAMSARYFKVIALSSASAKPLKGSCAAVEGALLS